MTDNDDKPDYTSYSLKELLEAKDSINAKKFPERLSEINNQIKKHSANKKTFTFTCAKCGSGECEVGEFFATDSLLTKMFDIQNVRFSTITCCTCSYTEIYKGTKDTLMNVLDLISGY